MAQIFIVNKSAALDGAYVSDLPVTNSTPVARQVGFYLPSDVNDYLTTVTAYLTDVGGVGDVATSVAAITTGVNNGTTLAAVDVGAGSIADVLAILMGAEQSGGAVAESDNLGNHKIVGNATRKIYTRDRVDASIHEGFLKVQLDAGSIVIYNVDGSVAHS